MIRIQTTTKTNIVRRSLLQLVFFTALLPETAFASHAKTKTVKSIYFGQILADFAAELLHLSPITATSLGLDSGTNFDLKTKLDDLGPSNRTAWAVQALSMKTRLASVDRRSLDTSNQLRFDTLQYVIDLATRAVNIPLANAKSVFGGIISPYPVTQMGGVIIDTPTLLDSQHQIKTAADAEAYLSRLRTMARALDEETTIATDQASQGIAPPQFIMATILRQLRDFRKNSANVQGLVTSIARRTNALKLSGNWEARAIKLVEAEVYPALDRQIAALGKVAENASDVAGVHKLPGGSDYYDWALEVCTTTKLNVAEIHAMGLQQNKIIAARVDTILRKQGMTKGSVGERIRALATDTRFMYPNTDEGRKALLAFSNDRAVVIKAMLPKISHLGLKSPFVIDRIPEAIQAGASLGYMSFASHDGARPAIYYINLETTARWPKNEVTTLIAHEGIPGHALQGAYLAEHSTDLPLISSLMGFGAFTEGWALYAEHLVAELGIYADDPFGEIGYLQAQQFRACRLVIDTGLHAMQWTREQAFQFLVNQTGKSKAFAAGEIDRYCVWPGQACSYLIGYNEIMKQRMRAQVKLGSKFDVRTFNDALIKTGGVPLTMLSGVIDRYIVQD